MEPLVTVCILSQDPDAAVKIGLFRQTYDNYEVIIANKPGIVPAMNDALERAKGEIFVRIDDDVELPDDWLRRIVKTFDSDSIAGVTGPTYVDVDLRNNRDSIRIARKPNSFLRWMFDGEPFACAKIYNCGSVSYGSNFAEKCQIHAPYYPDHLEGTNWAMRTWLIRAVGGFDPKFDGVAEWFDTDVEQKVKKLGYSLRYNSGAFLYHNLRKGSHYSERFEGWGRMKNWLRFHLRHSKFHYKKIIWFTMMGGYFLCLRLRQLFQR